MVRRKPWFFIGFLFYFVSVYALFVLVSIVPTALHLDINWAEEGSGNAFLYSANATMATATTMNWVPTIALLIAASIVISTILGCFAIGRGMEG